MDIVWSSSLQSAAARAEEVGGDVRFFKNFEL